VTGTGITAFALVSLRTEAHLTPGNSFLQLHVTEPDDAGRAADELHDLVET
jgi:hypothetical protein